MRTHPKVLIGPVVVLLVTATALGVLLALLPKQWAPWGQWALSAVAGLVVLCWVLRPFLVWLACTFTLTNRRIMTRSGVFNRTGHDLSLSRINDVETQRSLVDRMFGCGTLQLSTAAGVPLELPDVPDVFAVQRAITELTEQDTDIQGVAE